MKKKVLIFSDAKDIGGAEKYIQNLIDLLEDKYEIYVSGNKTLRSLFTKNFRLHVLSNKKPLRMIIALLKDLLKIKPDIIHLNLTHPTSLLWIQIISLFLPNKRIIGTLHLAVPNRFPKLSSVVLKRTYSKINIIFVAHSAKIELFKNYKFSPKDYYIIPNWINIKHFRPPKPEEREFVRQKFGIRNDQKVGLFLGRFEEQKNILAFPGILNEIKKYNWTLFLVGEGSLKNKLIKEIEKNQLNDFIRIHPFTNDPREFYWAADAFFLISNYECTPLTLLEAMSCGLSPVVTDVGDMKRMVGSEKFVWDRCVKHFIFPLNNSKSYSSEYWNNWVKDNFSSEQAKSKIQVLYERNI
ncbi:hypothetical protein C0971_16825 [Bacillus methanolicus]|uniref:glycosyltransferase family 4 protein n=1 Tax=Bacillus methanolicus TaxID=1471 RepID=UPI00200CBF07|nr:glycosyltransferase family 4 protein [Bacillus methanolicus]UQD53498.1 hypothetical protein C0971_16825 [Bacillus methanolicus]